MRAVAAATQHVAALAQACGGEKYDGSGGVSGALRTADQLQQQPVVAIANDVAQQGGWPVEIVHHYVDVADRKSTRLNSSHLGISYAVFCLKKKRGERGSSRRAAPCSIDHA